MARSKDSKKDSKKDAKAATDPTSMSRRQQFVESYRITKRSDPRIALWLIGSFLLFGGLGFALFMLLPGGGVVNVVLAVASALLFGLLGMLIVFGRRAQAAAYKQMEGQTGASLGAMRMLRRGWPSPASRTSSSASWAPRASSWSARATRPASRS